MSIKVELINEKLLTPDFDKLKTVYKVPEEYIDKNFGLYEIKLKCKDMGTLRTALWFIPVKHLVRDQNSSILTNSYKIVQGGKCLPEQFQFIWNNIEMSTPDKEEGTVHIQLNNFNKEKELVQYPLIYNKQLLGFLLPNSVIDDSYFIEESQHAGIHYTYSFYRRGLPEDQVIIYSLHKWSEVQKELDKVYKKYDIEKMNQTRTIVLRDTKEPKD